MRATKHRFTFGCLAIGQIGQSVLTAVNRRFKKFHLTLAIFFLIEPDASLVRGLKVIQIGCDNCRERGVLAWGNPGHWTGVRGRRNQEPETRIRSAKIPNAKSKTPLFFREG